jgi:hypothetical protein
MAKDLFHLLIEATKTGFLEWTPAEGENVENWQGKMVGCYKTTFNGVTIQTVLKKYQKKSFFDSDLHLVAGLIIGTGEQKKVFSTHPDLIPGEQYPDDSRLGDDGFLLRSFAGYELPELVENRDILSSIEGQLSRMLYATPRKVD